MDEAMSVAPVSQFIHSTSTNTDLQYLTPLEDDDLEMPVCEPHTYKTPL